MTERKGYRYLYECEDCHARRFVSTREANRAARPKCLRCGSIRLELVSEDARNDRASLNAVRIAGDTGSLVLSNQCKYQQRHRAVK